MAVPRTQFYHPARVIDAALHGIERAVRRAEGLAIVVGPPGTGKSLLLAKVAESVGDDFSVALLSGARICTRRALWQSILAEIGQPYRGIDEAELRIAVVELARSLAAAGSGLVVLVDEAHTLPLRLIEELRLLTNIPAPLPAVHVVLAGTTALEERLGSPKMESFSQRIAVRAYLEPLDHTETILYLRTQTKAAGLEWEKCFESGCDEAVYGAADGVPRLMNQICDQALVAATEARRRVRPSDIVAAWQEIQRLPSAALPGHGGMMEAPGSSGMAAGRGHEDDAGNASLFEPAGDGGVGVIEFGSLDDGEPSAPRTFADIGAVVGGFGADRGSRAADPWSGPDVEFVFDASSDPFQEFFEQEERIVERYLVGSPDDFRRQPHVVSSEGAALVRQLAELDDQDAGDTVARTTGRGRPADAAPGDREAREDRPPSGAAVTLETDAVAAPRGGLAGDKAAVSAAGGSGSGELDDADMVVIEEDLLATQAGQPAVAAVRLGDYRRLFARLRRGG